MCTPNQVSNSNQNVQIPSGTPSVQQMVNDQKPSYGNRPDGTQKGTGYLGEIQRPDGTVMTEITAGVNIKGKEIDIPLITPKASKDDLEYLKKADPKSKDFYTKMPKGLMDRAVDHAVGRMKTGKSVYKN